VSFESSSDNHDRSAEITGAQRIRQWIGYFPPQRLVAKRNTRSGVSDVSRDDKRDHDQFLRARGKRTAGGQGQRNAEPPGGNLILVRIEDRIGSAAAQLNTGISQHRSWKADAEF